MIDGDHKTLGKLLEELQAQRLVSMAPDDLRSNIEQRQLLEDTADRNSFVHEGDVIGAFHLPEVRGGAVDLDDLLQHGPVAVIFFRFEGCPVCNIAIPYYQQHLAPALAELGASLVAISPQVPESLVAIKDRYDLDFFVASDPDNGLARQLGITFVASDAAQAHARAKGGDLGATIGTGKWELPMPTALVIGPGRVVHFADVNPDWLKRTEAEPILDAVRSLVQATV
jgi:peroxiredoxin